MELVGCLSLTFATSSTSVLSTTYFRLSGCWDEARLDDGSAADEASADAGRVEDDAVAEGPSADGPGSTVPAEGGW